MSEARVLVGGQTIGAIDHGLLVLVCAEKGDSEANTRRLIEKVLAIRIFADEAGKMNRSVSDVGGGILLVPQFTLAADTRGGTRPSFSGAAAPERGRQLFELAVSTARERHSPVATGRFGAHMQVGLVNDGPVTIWLRIEPDEAVRSDA